MTKWKQKAIEVEGGGWVVTLRSWELELELELESFIVHKEASF